MADSKLDALTAATALDGSLFYLVRGGADFNGAADDIVRPFARVRVVDTTGAAVATAYENGDTIDGVVLATGDAVLRATSGGNAADGIYVVPASGAASRKIGFTTYNEHPGSYISVMEGTANADTLWRCTSNKGGTLGSTSLTFTQFTAGLAAFTAASSAGPAQMDFAEDTDNGTNKVSLKAPASLTGDVSVTLPAVTGTIPTGPTSTTDNTLPRFDGTAGALQTSGITVDDSNNLTAGPIITVTASGAYPQLKLTRTGTPASSVFAAVVNYNGPDSGGTETIYGQMNVLIADNTDTSEDGQYRFATVVAGTLDNRMYIGAGVFHPSATGGDKGNNTINFGAVYDDNTLLTCMGLQKEFRERGKIDLAKWDALTPDLVIPESREAVAITFKALRRERRASIEDQGGRLVRRVTETEVEYEQQFVWADPVYDEDGNLVDTVETPLFDEVVTPEQIIPRVHGTARVFKAMVESGFDPRDPEQYFAKMQADEALPGMPTKTDWKHNDLCTGDMLGRLWLAAEMQAIVANVMWLKLKDHEARLAALEVAR